MNIRKSSLTVAMAAVMSVGLVGQAAAYTSAGSVIEYQDLLVVLDPGIAFEEVNTFNFVTTNTTTLNGTTIADSDSCAGAPGPGGVTNTCSAGTPTLNSDLQLLGDGSNHGGENDFTLDGPGSGSEYSYSDSVIFDAALVGNPPGPLDTTEASLIAETELLNTGGGNSTSTIQSTSGFEFTFVVGDTGELTISFQADPDAYAKSENPLSTITLAEASVAAVITLSQDEEGDGSAGDGSVTWAPDGELNGCSGLSGGVGCSGEVDDENLNTKVGITNDGTEDLFSMDAQGTWEDFSITFTNLDSGLWTFTLTTTVANSVTKVRNIPEPGILMLLGFGMAGLAATRRRKKA